MYFFDTLFCLMSEKRYVSVLSSILAIVAGMLTILFVELLEEDGKADKLKSLPLYICRITG
jgi:hypothetical protein